MRKCLRITFIVLLVIFLGVVAWCVLRPPDLGPVYQGKPLSEWLNELDPQTGKLSAPATEAVHQFGTNAIPWLLAEAAANNAVFPMIARDLLRRQSIIKVHFAPSPDHQAIVLRGFRALGPVGIQGLAEGFTNSDSRIRFGCVGQWELAKDYPDTVFPPLADCLRDPAPAVRARAANAVGMLHLEPDKVVPVLTGMLSDPVDNVRSMAALGLSLYRDDAKSAYPALLKLLPNSSPEFYFFATNALKAIDPAAFAKSGIK